jgi:FdhE protein
VTLDGWLETHTYLRPIALLRQRIDAAIGVLDDVPTPAVPDWTDYRDDFLAGIPLLQSRGAALDLEPTERAIAALSARLQSHGFAGDPEAGLLRYAGWVVRCAALRPLLDAFDQWRDDDRWMRPYCPACGSPPAMAQLVGVDPGRRRLLSCGCCGTLWRYARTGCPFCEAQSHRLSSFGVKGEGGLRIDYCESCRGYLKTYDGHGAEAVLLADWTSLHLDVAARDRGLQRMGASLYEIA